MMEIVNEIVRWAVAPLIAFVFGIHMRVNKHATDIAVLKAQIETDKLMRDREMKDVKTSLERIMNKLDAIEDALRK